MDFLSFENRLMRRGQACSGLIYSLVVEKGSEGHETGNMETDQLGAILITQRRLMRALRGH